MNDMRKRVRIDQDLAALSDNADEDAYIDFAMRPWTDLPAYNLIPLAIHHNSDTPINIRGILIDDGVPGPGNHYPDPVSMVIRGQEPIKYAFKRIYRRGTDFDGNVIFVLGHPKA